MTRLRISVLSLIITTLILILKFYAYALTDSAALKSDALESVVNLVSAVFTLGAIIFAERPADKNHPYGHGKIEYFSAAFEGGLISLAAVLIFYEAARTWIEGSHVRQLNVGIILNLSAGALNGLLGWWLVREGRKNNSKALEADGHHVMSDFYTTLALIGGLIILKVTGFSWMDPLLAGLVGVFLARTGFKLVRESSGALLDQEDPQIVQRLVDAMETVRGPDVIAVHALRTLRSGRHTHVDVHVAVPEFFPLEKAHDIVDEFGLKALAAARIEGEFHAHLDPCRRLYCKHCAVEPCSVRVQEFQSKRTLSFEQAVALDPVDPNEVV